MSLSRIMIAGSTSGVGKTTVAVAIMHAMKKKGLKVQPFKVGPDFIDPSYHTFITGRQSRNLDVWLMGERGVLESFQNNTIGADVAIIEGVMGLFDGMSGKDDFASSAHVARILNLPIILVVDAAKTARSVAATVLGFMHFDRRLKITGVIVNNVASDRHAGYVADAMSAKIKVPVLGIIRRNPAVKMEERHLGLVPAQELMKKKHNRIAEYADYMQDQIDTERILGMCGKSYLPRATHNRPKAKTVTIAVALDESFNFYYADNLDALRSKGAELVFFSPVNDKGLPDDADAVILGGGFPEVLADKLEKNRLMIKSIEKASGEGMPIYGECGGLMYLTRSIRGYKGQERVRKMIGLIDADTVMTSRLTLNYTEANCDGPIFGKALIRGHEFHYSSVDNIAADSKFAYSLSKGRGIKDCKDGFFVGSTGLAAYMHLHFATGALAESLVTACTHYRRR